MFSFAVFGGFCETRHDEGRGKALHEEKGSKTVSRKAGKKTIQFASSIAHQAARLICMYLSSYYKFRYYVHVYWSMTCFLSPKRILSWKRELNGVSWKLHWAMRVKSWKGGPSQFFSNFQNFHPNLMTFSKIMRVRPEMVLHQTNFTSCGSMVFLVNYLPNRPNLSNSEDSADWGSNF